jgi:hypothetical protein
MTMTVYQLQRIRAIRSNIERYRRLLATELTDLERKYLERRLREEREALSALTSGSTQRAESNERSWKTFEASYG